MPLYDYECQDCGPFRTWQSMDEAASPTPCTDCGRLSPRLISAPNINRMDAGVRKALQRCDNSADAPSVVRQQDLSTFGRTKHARHSHRSHAPSRRWMIGH